MSLPRASFKSTPQDFRVEEIPSYEPSGTGDHVYVRFEKTNLTTNDAVRLIANGAGASPRDAGVAGLKDKAAVTTQQISLLMPAKLHPVLGHIESLAIDGIRILSVKRHGNKLKTGHLVGNRFEITLRNVAESERVQIAHTLERAGKEGVPNAYGQQRFGRDDDNDTRALEWLRGDAPAPRDPKTRRFMFSALQSRAFNAVLTARVGDGTWRTPIDGDVLCVHRSGGVFSSDHLADEMARAERHEISPTGPMPGATMKAPTGAALALESAIIDRVFGPAFDFERTRALGEGTRRPLRVLVSEMRVELPPEQNGVVKVYFVLPRGAYATTVLSSAVNAIEPEKALRTAEVETETATDESELGKT